MVNTTSITRAAEKLFALPRHAFVYVEIRDELDASERSVIVVEVFSTLSPSSSNVPPSRRIERRRSQPVAFDPTYTEVNHRGLTYFGRDLAVARAFMELDSALATELAKRNQPPTAA